MFVPAYKEEAANWVDGVHEGIIDEQTFYAVQDILEGRKKNQPNKIQTVRDEFPLRGFLSCPRCNSNLTASASKGKMGTKFFYYHCGNGCKERQKALNVNDKFSEMLNKITSNHQSMSLFAKILKEEFKNKNTTGRTELEKIQKEIGRQNQRVKNAKDLMLDGDLTANEYKEMKVEIEVQLNKLGLEEDRFREGIENYNQVIDDSLEVLKTLGNYYKSKGTATKQRIVSSVFPEKLTFENNEYRTPKINRAVLLLCRVSSLSNGTKKGKHTVSDMLSCQVVSLGIEPRSKV